MMNKKRADCEYGRRLIKKLIKEENIENALSLYPGKSREEVTNILVNDFISKLLILGVASLLIMLIVFLVVFFNRTEEVTLTNVERSGMNGESKIISGWIETPYGDRDIEFEVEPVTVSDEEMDRRKLLADKKLPEMIKGNNSDLEHIRGDLEFVTELEGVTDRIEWETDDLNLVTSKGKVNNQDIRKSQNIILFARLWFGNEFRLCEIYATVEPPEYSPQEEMYRKQKELVWDRQKDTRESAFFEIPEGVVIKQGKKSSITKFVGRLFIIPPIVFLLLTIRFNGNIRDKKKKRDAMAVREYREFITNVSLLMMSGASPRKVFFRLSDEYGGRKKSVLKDELLVTRNELENGVAETVAFEAFGNRLEDRSYQRFSSIMSQYVTKGVYAMQEMLTSEVKEVTMRERENVKIYGEMAGTKLLLPMMGLLAITFAVIMVPAFAGI